MCVKNSEDKAKGALPATVRGVIAGMNQLLALGEPWVCSHVFDATGAVAHWRDELELALSVDGVDPHATNQPGPSTRGDS
jgi:hypothetical protein